MPEETIETPGEVSPPAEAGAESQETIEGTPSTRKTRHERTVEIYRKAYTEARLRARKNGTFTYKSGGRLRKPRIR